MRKIDFLFQRDMNRLFVFGIFSRQYPDLLLFDFRVRAASYILACKRARCVLDTLNRCDDIYCLRSLNIDGSIPSYSSNNEQLKIEF